jgi:FKBP-type peptidyl-prolyl cis-trans isomerase
MKTPVALLAAFFSCAATLAAAGDVKLEDDTQKTIYALGLVMARNIATFNLNEKELELLEAGLSDGTLGRKPQVPLETWGPKIQGFANERQKQVAEIEKKAGDELVKKAAGEKGAVKTDSGLVYSEVKAGTGDAPTADSVVKVHYKGTLRDGTVFDSSIDRGQPATFSLRGVVPCWTEGLQKMKVGGKAKLVCPSTIAYGDRGHPPTIKPGSTLTFEVELLEIVKADATKPAPPAAGKPAEPKAGEPKAGEGKAIP